MRKQNKKSGKEQLKDNGGREHKRTTDNNNRAQKN